MFPFGHGLSYTTFIYSNMKVSVERTGTDINGTVSVDIPNSGSVFGHEVVQLC